MVDAFGGIARMTFCGWLLFVFTYIGVLPGLCFSLEPNFEYLDLPWAKSVIFREFFVKNHVLLFCCVFCQFPLRCPNIEIKLYGQLGILND